MYLPEPFCVLKTATMPVYETLNGVKKFAFPGNVSGTLTHTLVFAVRLMPLILVARW